MTVNLKLQWCFSGRLTMSAHFHVTQLVIKECNVKDTLCVFFTDQILKHWVKKYGWREEDNGMIFIANQDENIKTKNITEKIDFESAAAIMAASR